MHPSFLLLLLLSSAAFSSPISVTDSPLACLELFRKVVFRNATALDAQRVVNCFGRIPTLHDSLSTLTPAEDIEQFGTKCFGDFLKFTRGLATPKQVGKLPVCGWDTVKILHELHKSGSQVVEIPLNEPLAALMRLSGEKFASQCLNLFEQAITGPKSAIEIEALQLCGSTFLRKAKYSVDRYTELALQEGPAVTRAAIQNNLDSIEQSFIQCFAHVLGVLTGSEEPGEGSLAYCSGVFMTTTRFFVDLATGKDPVEEERREESEVLKRAVRSSDCDMFGCMNCDANGSCTYTPTGGMKRRSISGPAWDGVVHD